MFQTTQARERVGSALGFLGLLTLLALAGCSSKTGTISGKVLLNGQPLPGGDVSFVSVDQTGKVLSSQAAPIQSDGSYSIAKVPIGPVKITVEGKAGIPKLDPAKMNIPKTALPPIRQESAVPVPRRYGKLETTDLALTVQGGSQEHNIELK
jgi:hypothetical protein